MIKKETGSSIKPAGKTAVLKSAPLKALFKDAISDLYWAENHLLIALPKMISAASAPSLKRAIEAHLKETAGHVTRLEEIFGLLGEKAIAKKCDAMEGLSREGEKIVEETEAGTATRDAGIILASQKVEHYEMASYAGLYQLATTLGLEEIASLLAQTLDEEKKADQQLSQLAEKEINNKAAQEG